MNPSSDWSQLLRVALLGTRQSGEAVPALPDLPAPAAAAPREAQVLAAAGALGLLRKAGHQPPAATATLPEPAPPDALLPLSPQAADALRQLLDGRYPDVFPEFLTQTARHGRRVPVRLLVPFLDYVSTRPALQAGAADVLGERGRWLARLHPAWAALLPAPPDEAGWETGSATQRQTYLRTLRRRDPARARALLAAALPQEPAKQQAQLLSVLEDQPSAADAPLLEPYLTSKSKDVRQLTASLLVRVPGNALLARLWPRATAHVVVHRSLLRGNRLTVTLPEAWSPAWQAEGIEAKDTRFGGEKAAWLGQLLALIPPARWSAHFDLAPARLLALAADSEWAQLLLTAWRLALLLHPDADWARAYLALQLEREAVPPFAPAQLINMLSPAEVAQALRAALPPRPRLVLPEARWEALLLGLPGPWPPALTEQALQVVDNTLTVPVSAQRYQLSYRVAQLLRHMQLAVPPEQYELCAAALSPLREADSGLSGGINQLLDALYFRRQLAAAWAEPPAADG